MAGTKSGSLKAQAIIKERYGLTEDGKSALHSKAGTIGGKSKHDRAFALNPELASRAGKKGGLAKRNKNK